jgi:hypothetical protein
MFGAGCEEVRNRLIEAEKKSEPELGGYAVLIAIEKAKDFSGQPLS